MGPFSSSSSSSKNTNNMTIPVTPPPPPRSSTSTGAPLAPPPPPACHRLVETLKPLLKPSEKDFLALLKLLDTLGCHEMADLPFLLDVVPAEPNGGLSPVLHQKLRTVAEFVRRGGKITDGAATDMAQIVQQLDVSKQTQTPIQPTKSEKINNEPGDEIVKLDIGGHPFKTTRKTLTSVPGSFFDAMFSGRYEIPATRMEDGTYFIDREGSLFHHVLNFLRHRDVVTLPRDPSEQKALVAEADFYCLEQLVRAVTMPKIDTTAYVSDEIAKIWKDEETLRTAFRTGQTKDFTPYQGLVPLFSPDDGLHSLPLKYNPPEESDLPPLVLNFRDEKLEKNQAITVTTLDQFRSSFNRNHANVLHRLNDILREEPVIIAGGSVLQALTIGDNLRPRSWWPGKGDVDLFVYASSASEANRIARRIFYTLAVDHERWVIVRSRGVITMHSLVGDDHWLELDQKIQIVLRLFDSPSEVLVGFDCDCCGCAYDGREVWATPRCLHALRSGLNVLNPIHAWPNRPSYELRLGKYANRGFGVAVPGLDKKRINNENIRQQTLDKLKGLARLLKVSFAMEKDSSVCEPAPPLNHDDLREHSINELDEADLLVTGRESYDDEIEGVIIPRVYGAEEPRGFMWRGSHSVDFPLAREARDEAWAVIEDAGGTEASVTRVPDRLENAWDTDKRSREYLNSEGMDKVDLDSGYYDHAYEQEG